MLFYNKKKINYEKYLFVLMFLNELQLKLCCINTKISVSITDLNNERNNISVIKIAKQNVCMYNL